MTPGRGGGGSLSSLGGVVLGRPCSENTCRKDAYAMLSTGHYVQLKTGQVLKISGTKGRLFV
jgi:hypothetical protein